jgi:MerR family transcriptional regulator, copper efflux regulator
MRIGEVAKRASVPAKTIRFWEELGLLPRPERTSSDYRNYEAAIVDRLKFVRHAQAAGFTLRQVRGVLEVGDSGEPPCEHVAQLIAARLEDVDARIAELKATRAHLHVLAERAATQDPADCSGYCSILSGPGP